MFSHFSHFHILRKEEKEGQLAGERSMTITSSTVVAEMVPEEEYCLGLLSWQCIGLK